MYFTASLLTSALVLSSHFCVTSALESERDRQVTVYSWPLASSTPQELASIGYNPQLDQSSLLKFTPPPTNDDLVRVGLYDPKTSDWTGVVTAGSSFDAKYQQKIELHVDDESRVWHVGFTARPKPKAKPLKDGQGRIKKETTEVPQVVIEIVRPKPGPTPHLNQPVVLSPEGKVPEKEPEKTFLQKYWWAIALFIVLQIALGGGGAGGDK